MRARRRKPLARNQGDLWDSGKVTSSETLQIEYAGKPLASDARVFWKIKLWDAAGTESAWSTPATFSTAIMQAPDWKAKWIAFPNDDANRTSQPAPCFRRDFTLAKPITRATLHICGLGQYELTLNGKKVGDSVLTPAWTAYASTCAYDTYDVTAQIKPGANAVGIMLGNGMYNVLRVQGRYTKFAGSLGVPKAIAQLDVEYADGTRATVATDAAWKTARGPVIFNHTYGGEDYDARKELPGWASPNFTDTSWLPAAETTAPGDGAAQLTAAINPPIKIMHAYPISKITQPTPGTWIIDFGQNLSGWPHLKVKGPAGATIRLTPAEQLTRTGAISQGPSGSPMWFSYTLKGDGTEDWRPRFSYYGYRYLQITGALPPGIDADAATPIPQISEITSEFIHADIPAVGTFQSSNDTLNRIHTLINMAILSNTQSVLTDCPHREKLGWLEQSHLVADGIAMNYDVSSLYAKICRDMRDSQTAAGLIPDIAPEYTVFSGGFRDSPEWGSAAVIDPWFLYQTYGDVRVLSEQYTTMKKYAAYLESKSKDDIVAHGLGDWYDIGPAKPGNAQLTSLGLTSTALYFRDLEILRDTARLLKNTDDEKHYADQAVRVRAAFNKKFFDPATGAYEKSSQTALAMPLALGLVDPAQRAALTTKLADSIQANKYHVTAGDVGFSYVVRALTDSSRGDVMLDMMLQSDGPGYVDQLKKGATTLTEAWDAQASSSQNHLMLGHAEAWLYRGLAGIQNDPAQDAVAFKHILIHPQVAGDVASASAEYQSPRGLIASAWKRDNKSLSLTITIPANTTATLDIPSINAAAITESGKPASSAAGLKFDASSAGTIRFTAGSGTYHFQSALP